LPAVAVLTDQSRVLQHLEVLGDRRTGHVEAGRKLRNRDSATSQAVENRAARGVSYGMKDVDTRSGSGHFER
jgi:hypothetical protein